jgi:hypothetical protein
MRYPIRSTTFAVSVLLFAAAGPVPAADAQSDDSEVDRREEEMFGDEKEDEPGDSEPADDDQDDNKDAEPTERKRREERMFGGEAEDAEGETEDGGDSGLEERLSEKIAEENDPLQLGGTYFGRLNYTILEEGDPVDFPLSQPNITDVYFDARPTDRLRFYAQGRLLFDPTVDPDEPGRFGQTRDQLDLDLDQLWLKFDIDRTVYITVGRQQLRWGVGRFWFPNDFLFTQKRDPLAIFDERTGVDLVKLHVPVESLGWNFYAVAQLDGADSPEKVGGAARAEFLVDQTEFAVSSSYRDGDPLQLGIDVSSGVGPFDLRGAFTALYDTDQTFYRGDFEPETLSRPNPSDWVVPTPTDREGEWLFRGLAGAELGLRVFTDDTLFLGGEYFYNDLGYEDADLYPWLIFQGAFRPFYVGRHYAGLYASLPSPGQWDDTSFTASTLGNLSDRSFLSRLDFRLTMLTRLQFFAYGMLHWGNRGEFNLRVELPPIELPDAPDELEDGLSVPATRAQIGVGLQLDF